MMIRTLPRVFEIDESTILSWPCMSRPNNRTKVFSQVGKKGSRTYFSLMRSAFTTFLLLPHLLMKSEAFVSPTSMPMHPLHTSSEHRSVSQLFSVSSPGIRTRKMGDIIEDEWRIQGSKKSPFPTRFFKRFSQSNRNPSIGRILPWSFVGITLLTIPCVAGVAHATSTIAVGSSMMPAATATALPAWQLVVATLLLMAQSFGGSVMNLASIGLQKMVVW